MKAKELISERKKSKRKTARWAAYGPGPYGGYGYLTGYSGDGGIGEASYPGNIGAMEVAKFFRQATDEEKHAFKELLNQKKLGLAWHLIQKVTGVKLQGQEFQEDRTADVVFDTGETKRVRYHPTGQDIVDAIIRYYLRQGLKVVKIDNEDIEWDDLPEHIEEGWRDIAAGLALGAGIGMSGPASAKFEKVVVSKGDTVYSIARAFDTDVDVIQKLNRLDKNYTIQPGQTIRVPKLEPIDEPKKNTISKKQERKIEPLRINNVKTLTGKPYEALLTATARKAGITDPIELAAFLAQTSVETGGFRHMREIGNKSRIERMYDPKFNQKGAKILGNTKPGDGWRYRGRGFIQLTGRDNYTRASRDLGIDLVKDPDLVARDPEVAARTSVWYWKTHVRNQVRDFRNTAAVTRAVQGGSSALDRREREFQDFKRFKLAAR